MRRKITNETWEQVKTAFASGIGLREIARNMGIPEGTVLARAKRESWTREIQSAKTLAKREDAAPSVSPVQAVAMSMQQRGERHVERIAGVSERGLRLSAVISQYFTRAGFCLFCSPHGNAKVLDQNPQLFLRSDSNRYLLTTRPDGGSGPSA